MKIKAKEAEEPGPTKTPRGRVTWQEKTPRVIDLKLSLGDEYYLD